MVKGRCRCRLAKGRDKGKDKDKEDHLGKGDLAHHMVNLDILRGKDKAHHHHNIRSSNSVSNK